MPAPLFVREELVAKNPNPVATPSNIGGATLRLLPELTLIVNPAPL